MKVKYFTPADDMYHLNKFQFETPFVCGARNIGEALRRIGEGALHDSYQRRSRFYRKMLVEAVRHMRTMMAAIRRLQNMPSEEADDISQKKNDAPYDCGWCMSQNGKLPVVNFAAGGIATPLPDAALMMQLGSEGVFVGSGIF